MGNTKIHHINRDDMLELTRRMTLKRNCFDRIAGAYLDEEGFIDGTFHTHFLKLKPSEQTTNLQVAKAIPFAETNKNLKEYSFTGNTKQSAQIRQLLLALRSCDLKNDALLDLIYENFGSCYQTSHPYAVYFFHGSYDVPRKGLDKEELWESEEVYQFLICAVCPVHGDYEIGSPECGFLYPAFTDRSTNTDAVAVFQADDAHPHLELENQILGLDL